MAVNGGILRELIISHPTAGNKTFYGIKGEDSTYILGGYTKENTVAANGALISNMQPQQGSFKCTTYSDMSETVPAFEYLQSIMNDPQEATVSFTNANGISYGGSGTIEGTPELSGNNMSVQFEFVSGAGFTQI